MATHRISFWEVTATNEESGNDIKFGISGALSKIDKSVTMDFESFIADSVKGHGETEEFYKNGKYCARTKNPELISLSSGTEWPYGNAGDEKLENCKYMTMSIEAGIDHNFNYSYSRKLGKDISIKDQHQLRVYKILFIFPENSTQAYVALESISGISINSIFEKHISNIITTGLRGKKISFSLERIVDSQAFIDALKSYTPKEVEIQVDKTSGGRKGKAAVERISTGLTEGEAKAIVDDIISLVGGKVNLTSVVQKVKNHFEISVPRVSKAKVRLVNPATKTSKTLDLYDLAEYIDISFDPQKGNDSEYFWKEAVSIADII